jgi:hypothetical protein
MAQNRLAAALAMALAHSPWPQPHPPHTEGQIFGDYPELTRENIRACPGFAAVRERRLFNSAG